jgi:hypothetical protein
MRTILFVWILAGCGSGGSDGPEPVVGDGQPPACTGAATYPEGAVAEMTLGGVITPYRWAEAIDRAADRARIPLDLGLVPCNVDANLDWSPADVLLFSSLPAW